MTDSANVTKFMCKNCLGTICLATDFVCFFPPVLLNLNGGALFTNAVPRSLQFEPVSSGLSIATCHKCLTSLGFKIVDPQGYPPYVKDDMLYLNIDMLTHGVRGVTTDDFLSPNAFFCKSCLVLIADESNIQNHAMMQNNSTKRVVLSSVENCILDEIAPPMEDFGSFRGVMCCAGCGTPLGWRRVISYDGIWIEDGVSHLQLDKLWFRCYNIMTPAERMIAPSST